MLQFKFYIRVGGVLTTAFEAGTSMREAFDKVTNRYPEAAFVEAFQIRWRHKK